MALFRLDYNDYSDSWISIKNQKELTKEQQSKLENIMISSIEDSWDYDEGNTYLENCSVEGSHIEFEENDLIFCIETASNFISEVYGDYYPGRTYGPMEDCYPDEIDFEGVEIIFRNKKCIDLISDKISKEECLQGLEIDDIEIECSSMTECSSYEMV